MKEQLLLNNRYLVSSEKNMITDRVTHEEARLEQRLVEVLVLLAANPRKLVARDTIIREVWNDYGGADEGLTQAISILRKVLNDPEKKIIETIPKKGYILNASVTTESINADDRISNPETPPAGTKKKSGKWAFLLIISVLIISGIIYTLLPSTKKENPPADIAPSGDIRDTGSYKTPSGRDTTYPNSPDMIPDSLRHVK